MTLLKEFYMNGFSWLRQKNSILGNCALIKAYTCMVKPQAMVDELCFETANILQISQDVEKKIEFM